MLQRLLLITLTLCSLSASAQWQQTGSKVRYVNGLGIPTKDTAAGVAADSSQIVIRPADSSLYLKYKMTWIKVANGTLSGTTNRVAKFTGATTLGNSQITDNGISVGINQTSPIYQLHVTSGGSAVVFTDAGNAAVIVGTNASATASAELSLRGNILTMTGAGINGAEHLRINASGNVGINNTTPNEKLSIVQSPLTSYPTLGTASGILSLLGDSKLYGLYTGINTTFGDAWLQVMRNNAATAYNLLLQPVGGRVLIGTTTDNGVDKLQVSGGVTASGTLTAATIVKSGGTSSQFLMADGSTSLGGGGTLSGTTNYVPKFTSSTAIGNSQIIDNGTNLSLRTTASTYPVNINLGANSGIGFHQDGITATIIGTNQNLTAAAPLQFQATQYIFTGTAGGKITVNTSGDNGVDHLQVNGSISGIGMKQAYVAKTGAYTATNADYVIDCTSGTFTVTLPPSSGRTGRILIIKNSGAGTITVDGNASETIDGAATVTMAVQYGTIQIMSDGTNWKTIAKF